jgi:hypothetical protein
MVLSPVTSPGDGDPFGLVGKVSFPTGILKIKTPSAVPAAGVFFRLGKIMAFFETR